MSARRRLRLVAGLALLAAGPAQAQLYGGFTPHAAHGPMNVWFGTARDAAGRYLPGVTVVLETSTLDFVAVTDRQGRFRLELPLQAKPPQVTVRCSKQGHGAARVVRRLPRGGAATPVEIACTLG